jgi:hypothetical protein
MSKKNGILVLIVAAGALSFSRLSIAKPHLSKDAMVGVWEAVIAEDVRVVRMEIAGESGRSLMAMSVGRVRPITSVFEVRKIDISREQNVTIEAWGVDGEDRLVVRGAAVALENDGRIDGTLAIQDSKGQEINRWRVVFVNLGGRFLETVNGLSQDSQKAIEKIRAGVAPVRH